MKQISKIINTREYFRSLEGAYVCYIAQKVIEQTLPGQKNLQLSYRQRILNIKTKNNYLAVEVKLKSKKILEELNKKFKKNKVKKLRIGYG